MSEGCAVKAEREWECVGGQEGTQKNDETVEGEKREAEGITGDPHAVCRTHCAGHTSI